METLGFHIDDRKLNCMSWVLQTLQQIALGNGTRPRGFTLATFDVPDDFDFGGIACLPLSDREASIKESVTLADGVELTEVVNAMRNLGGAAVQLVSPNGINADDSPSSEVVLAKIPVSELQVSQAIKSALSAIGVANLQELADYGDEHEGFESVEGISATQNKKLIEAIRQRLDF